LGKPLGVMFHVKHLEVVGSNISVSVFTPQCSAADFAAQNHTEGVIDGSLTHNQWRSQTTQNVVWSCLAVSVVAFFLWRGMVL
jgi:hypothetical protein